MARRTLLSLLAAAPIALGLGACGSDTVDAPLATPVGTEVTTTGSIPTPSTDRSRATGVEPTTTAVSDESVPAHTGPGPVVSDDSEPAAVLSYTESGGFTTREFAFQDPPIVLITTDGEFITLAAQPTVFPGPLLPAHVVRTIDEAGIANIVAAADEAGLLADVTYDRDPLIADASTASLTIEADGTAYVHEAYALGFDAGLDGDASTEPPRRQELFDFLTALRDDPESLAGRGTLGEPEPWRSDAYQLVAEPVTDPGAGYDVEPTIEAWPDGTGIELSEASECTEVPAVDVGSVLDNATQSTFFTEDDVTYQVIARPAYPGRSCT